MTTDNLMSETMKAKRSETYEKELFHDKIYSQWDCVSFVFGISHWAPALYVYRTSNAYMHITNRLRHTLNFSILKIMRTDVQRNARKKIWTEFSTYVIKSHNFMSNWKILIVFFPSCMFPNNVIRHIWHFYSVYARIQNLRLRINSRNSFLYPDIFSQHFEHELLRMLFLFCIMLYHLYLFMLTFTFLVAIINNYLKTIFCSIFSLPWLK